MKTSKIVAYGSVAALVLMAVLVFAPNATAQAGAQLTVTSEGATPNVPGKSGRLAPETQTATIVFAFKVSIPDTGGAGVAACPTANIVVTFEPTRPGDWSTITLSSYSKVVTLTPQEPTANVDTEMSITTTRKARAFVSDTYEVKASAAAGPSGCTFTPSAKVPNTAFIQNDYIPILEYSPAKYIQKTGQNKEVLFPIEITNFGNAQTKVATSVDQPNKNKLDAVLPPSVTTLNTDLESKTDVKKTIVIAARTPSSNGYTNTLYSFFVNFAGTATTPGPEIATDNQQITLSVQVQGVYVPGFDFTSLIGALGIGLGALGFLRRRLG